MDISAFMFTLLLGVSRLFVNAQFCDKGEELNNVWPFFAKDTETFTCPEGWQQRGLYCFRLYADAPQTWLKSNELCQNEGGHLVKLQDELVTLFVAKKVLNITQLAWTGLRIDNWDEITGVWTDGTMGGGFNGQWDINRPMEGLGDCVAVSSCDGRFTNMPCSETLPAVCQMTACQTGEFHCQNDRCVQGSAICDGVDDCGDMSDELLGDELLESCAEVVRLNEDIMEDTFSMQNYDSNKDYYILFSSPVGTRLQIQFTQFDTEPDKDILYIFFGGSTFETSRFVDALSGDLFLSVLPYYISDNNYALLRFTTDNDVVRAGFTCTVSYQFSCDFAESVGHFTQSQYQATAKDKTDCLNSCLEDTQCKAVTFISADSEGCRTHSFVGKLETDDNAEYFRKPCPSSTTENKQDELPNGGGELMATDVFQTFFSPYYPVGSLYRNLQLSWVIQAAGDGPITLTALDIAIGKDDVVKVFDGDLQDEAKVIAEYRGGSIDVAFVVTTGRSAIVTFDSQSEQPGNGVLFGYQEGCLATVDVSTTDLFTPGYTIGQPYPDLLSCEFIIRSENVEQPLSILFSNNFQIKAKDSLTIEVSDDTGTLVQVASVSADLNDDTTEPPVMDWIGRSVLKVAFQSNAVDTGLGFFATVSSGCSDLGINDSNIRILDPSTGEFTKIIPQTFNSSVYITCVDDYYLSAEEFGQCPGGNNTNSFLLTCGRNGKWNAPRIPSCTKRVCGLPPTIDYGFLSAVNGVESGDTATYQCIPGYESAESKIVTCQNGKWGSLPACYATTCDPLSVPENGNIIYHIGSGTSYDTVAEFQCDPGYYLTAESMFVCKNTDWVGGNFPTCEPLYCEIPNVQRGEVESESGESHPVYVPHGERVRLTCDKGYVVSGTLDTSDVFTCNRSDAQIPQGSFGPNREDIACVDDDECTNPDPYPGPCQDVCINTVGSYRCACSYGRELNDDNHTCSYVNECNQIEQLVCVNHDGIECLDNVQKCHSCTDLDPGFECMCNEGFHIWKGDTMEVIKPRNGENGREIWHVLAENVSCVRNTCDALPEQLDNGIQITVQDTYFYKHTVAYQCNIGYQIYGSDDKVQELQCRANGTWYNNLDGGSTVLPCSRVKCPGINLTAIQDNLGLVMPDLSTADDIPFGESVIFNCTIPSDNPQTYSRSQQCIYDFNEHVYKLIGDSLECKRISCDQVPSVSGMKELKNTTKMYYNDSFIFECQESFTRMGSSNDEKNGTVVRCMDTGFWDLGDLRCIGSACTDPGTPPGAAQVPCPERETLSYEAGSCISYKCERSGYMYTGPDLSCVVSEGSVTWSANHGSCEDVEKPTIDCDSNTLYVQRYMPLVNITVPMASDNTGIQSIVSSFRLGTPIEDDKNITFTTFDYNNNTNSCVVKVRVLDADSPICTTCSSKQVVTIENEKENVIVSFTRDTLLEIVNDSDIQVVSESVVDFNPNQLIFNVSDIGSGKTTTVTLTNKLGKQSQYTLYYEAKAVPCAEFLIRPPLNGDKMCSSNNCRVSCRTNFTFGKDYEEELDFRCIDPGQWIDVDGNPAYVPDCSRTSAAVFTVEVDLYYFDLNNPGQLIPSSCIDDFQKFINDTSFEANVTSSVEESDYFMDVCALSFKMDEVKLAAVAGVPDSQNQTSQILFTYVLRMTTLSDSPQDDVCLIMMEALFLKGGPAPHLTSGDSACPRISADISDSVDGHDYTIPEWKIGDDNYGCNDEREVVKRLTNQCYFCPPGTYFNQTTDDCVKCAAGLYQTESGQTTCDSCPEGTSTPYDGSQNEIQCVALCPPGFTSSNGLSPCTTVTVGSYWNSSEAAQLCPDGTKNFQAGAEDISTCKEPCLTGSYSTTGYEPCELCPPGFYQNETNAKTCERCPDSSQSTSSPGAASMDECISDVTMFCSSVDCNGNGSCNMVDNIGLCICYAGFSGLNCEIAPDPCSSDPCYNYGQCIQHPNNTYSCNCTSDYDGDHCENLITDPCETRADECKNNASCHATGNNKFECLCRTDSPYSGTYCETLEDICSLYSCNYGTCNNVSDIRRTCLCDFGYESEDCSVGIDFCEPDPCLHDGTCHIDRQIEPEGFKCDCVEGFNGTRCEIRPDSLCDSQDAINACGSDRCFEDLENYRFKCICDPGSVFNETNERCEVVDVCEKNPCFNDGTCMLENNNEGFSCNCITGMFRGAQCQDIFDPCEQFCNTDNSVCTVVGNEPKCVCDPGFTGDTCDEYENLCITQNPCEEDNTEECLDLFNDFTCMCKVGFTGRHCEHILNVCDSKPCLHGICENSKDLFNCSCEPGWTGDQCDTPERVNSCTDATCDGGKCYDLFNTSVCICDSSVQYGEFCENEIDACRDFQDVLCLNGGTCKNVNGEAQCECETGQSGGSCQCEQDFCVDEETACLNGGTCITQTDSFRCECASGFSGDRCETNIDDCSKLNLQCEKCVDGVNVAYCRCPYGTTGRECDKAADYNYDLKFSGKGASRLIFPAVANVTDFTLILYVRFSEINAQGTIFSMCAAEMETTTNCGNDVLTITDENFCLRFGVDIESACDNFTPLNDGDWHAVMLSHNRDDGMVRLYVDTIPAVTLNYEDVFILPEFVIIQLGATFEGSISRVELYDFVFDEALRTLVRNNDLIGMQPIIPWDNYERSNVLYVYESEYCIAGCPSIGVQRSPTVNECPEYVYVSKLQEDAEANVYWKSPTWFNSQGSEEIINNYNPGLYNGGAYQVFYRITNQENNFAQCSFNFYVSYDKCLNLANTSTVQFQCTDYKNGSYKSCIPECKNAGDGEYVFLESVPNRINCGPSGVYDPSKPTQSFQISECGKKCVSLLDVKFNWTYSSNSDNTDASLDQLKEMLRTKWDQAFVDNNLCTEDGCRDIQITVTQDPNPVSGAEAEVYISFIVAKAPNEIAGAPTERAIKQAVLQDEKFDVTDVWTSLSYIEKSFLYNELVVCRDSGCQIQGTYCVECTTGTYHNDETGLCTPCLKGWYQDTTAQDHCKPCPVGFTTEQEGAKSESFCYEICPAGQKNLQGNCVDCGYGYYQGATGQTICISCEPGRTTYVTNATSESQCNVACEHGEQLNEDNICEICPQGTYRTVHVDLSCISCQVNRTTIGEGAISQADCTRVLCDPGWYRVGDDPGDCQICDYGTWSSAQMNDTYCEMCQGPADMYTTETNGDRYEDQGATDESHCKPYCPAGFYLGGEGSCNLCPENYYKTDHIGFLFSTDCVPCPSSRPRNLIQGSTSLDDCKYPYCGAGQHVNPEFIAGNFTVVACLECEIDSYQPDENTVEDSCIPCEQKNGLPTSTLSDGSKYQSDCLAYCEPGQELQGDSCIPCIHGYYKNNTGNHTAKFGNCIACPDGKTTPESGSGSKDECTLEDCSLGEFLNQDFICEECGIGKYQDVNWRDTLPSDRPYITECKSCPEGTSTSGKGRSSESDCTRVCESGEEDVNDVCTKCQIGFYKNNTDDLTKYSLCTICPAEYITENLGSTSIDDCKIANCSAGTFRNTSKNSCEPCPMGTFSSEKWQTNCAACPTDENGVLMGTEGTGAVSADQCIVRCSPGQYRSADNTCNPCKNGTYSDSDWQGNCTVCPRKGNRTTLTAVEEATSRDQCSIYPYTRLYKISFRFEGSLTLKQRTRGTDEWRTLRDTFAAFLQVGIRYLFVGFQKSLNPEDGIEEDSFFPTRGSAVFTADVEVDNSDFPNEIQDVVAANILNDINEALETESNELTAMINTNGSGGIIGDPILNSADIQVLDTDYVVCLAGHYFAKNGLCQECPENMYTNPTSINVCESCPTNTSTEGTGATTIDACKRICPPGEQKSFDGTLCEVCPEDTYKSELGPSDCTPCGTTTDGITRVTGGLTGATSSNQCKAICPAGQQESMDGTHCEDCPVDTYKSVEGTSSCTTCDTLDGTRHVTDGLTGATNVSQCKVYCAPGFFYHKNLTEETCLHCPVGQYNPHENAISCMVCDKYLSTVSVGSTSEADCKSACEVVDGYCENGGSCTFNDRTQTATCVCVEPYRGETCAIRGEYASDTEMILYAVFGAVGAIGFITFIILGIRLHFIKKERALEQRKKELQLQMNLPQIPVAPPSYYAMTSAPQNETTSFRGSHLARSTVPTRALYYDEQEEHEDIYESHLPTPEGSQRVRDSGLYGTQRSWYQASICSSRH